MSELSYYSHNKDKSNQRISVKSFKRVKPELKLNEELISANKQYNAILQGARSRLQRKLIPLGRRTQSIDYSENKGYFRRKSDQQKYVSISPKRPRSKEKKHSCSSSMIN